MMPVKPPLRPLTGESFVPAANNANYRNDTQADIHARGFGVGTRVHYF